MYDQAMKLVEREGFWIREEYADQDLVIVHDIYQNDAYRLRLIEERVKAARYVIDIGAHIGCFARLVRDINPTAKIVCVEAEPLNWEALERNVGEFAVIIKGACSYDPRPLHWFSAFAEGECETTGGGCLAMTRPEGRYRESTVMIPKLTLEHLRGRFDGMNVPPVDLLKLDCEGSEFSIVANCMIDMVKFIVGEYHGRREWDLLREWRVPHWDYGHMSESGNLGNFHLRNTRWQ